MTKQSLYAPLLLCLLAAPTTFSWIVSPAWTTTSTRSYTTTTSTHSLATLVKATDDDYEAWLEQLDPSKFDEEVPRGGFKSHDYERDWKADRSNVDERAVDRLLAQRLDARKRGQFDKADELRDELLTQHGVKVFDRDRLWRTGCSVSGSGQKWPGRNNNYNSEGSSNFDRRGGARDDRRGGARDDRRSGARDDRRSGGGGWEDRRGGGWEDRRGGARDDRKGGWDDRRGGGGGREERRPAGGRPRRDSNFGPNGHDYTMAPDAGPLTTTLSMPQIHQLIAERLQCKLNRDFRSADAIENELFQNGVWVHDGMKLWRADGVGFGDNRRGAKPGIQPGSRQDLNRPYEMSKFSEPLVVEEGLDEEAAREAAEALKAKIEQMVQEREDARLNRDFELADDIRQELVDVYNVYVNDRKREWCKGGYIDAAQEMSPYSLPISSLKTDFDDDFDEEQVKLKIQALVGERIKCKVDKDYETADRIKDDLRDIYNVQLDDRNRMWSIGGQFQPPPEPYKRSTNSKFPLPVGITEDEVNQMLMEREAARKEKAFAVADNILYTLQDKYGIVVMDGPREWFVDENKSESSEGSSTSGALGYSQRGGGAVSDQDRQKIEDLINERSMYKSQRDFATADRIRDQLQEEYNVRLDDRNREWHVVTDAYVHVPTAIAIEDETLSFIQNQVNERAVARLGNDWERADAIRDSLMDEFGVYVDDRLKEWSVVVDPNKRLVTPLADMAITEDAGEIMSADDSEDDYDMEEGEEGFENEEEGEHEGEEELYSDEEEEEEINVEEEELMNDEENEQTNDDQENIEASEGEYVDLESLKVVDLKEMLRAEGLPVSGKKSELIERIRANKS